MKQYSDQKLGQMARKKIVCILCLPATEHETSYAHMQHIALVHPEVNKRRI